MAYVVIKTINGRQYRYEQRSWREGKRVRTESRYLGPVIEARRARLTERIASFIAAQRLSPEDRALATAERKAERIAQEQREKFGETAQERADREQRDHLDQLHDRFGLTLGPIDPTPPEPTAAAGGAESGQAAGADSPGGAQS
jgi:hypothetical protein